MFSRTILFHCLLSAFRFAWNSPPFCSLLLGAQAGIRVERASDEDAAGALLRHHACGWPTGGLEACLYFFRRVSGFGSRGSSPHAPPPLAGTCTGRLRTESGGGAVSSGAASTACSAQPPQSPNVTLTTEAPLTSSL